MTFSRVWVAVLLVAPAVAQMTVPFVGCPSDGQAGPREAPQGADKLIVAGPKTASGLAYYKGTAEPGVLAPRGWHCFGFYGSGGEGLLIAPEPLDFASVGQRKSTGPAILMLYRNGDTSGRSDVAEVIARVFPAYRSFVAGVLEMFDWPASTFPIGPYPKDELTYKGNRTVEFVTPPETEGLGTRHQLAKNGSPIDGVAVLVVEAPDLAIVSVRLPLHQRSFASTIIRHFEAEVPKQ